MDHPRQRQRPHHNYYIAGCAGIKNPLGKGYYYAHARYDRRAANLRTGWGCNLGPYRIAPTRAAPAVASQAVTARSAAAQPAGDQFEVAKGQRRIGLAVKGRGAAPQVEFIAPDGLRFTTPAYAGEIGGVPDRAVAAQMPENQEVVVGVERPAAGVWTVRPVAGSVPITSVEIASPLPERPVVARVVGSGRKRTLVYRAKSSGRRLHRHAAVPVECL